MHAPRFFRCPLFIVPAVIFCLLASFITYRVTRPKSYELFQRIKIGSSFSEVTNVLGNPTDSHKSITNCTDYLFVVTGHPDYPVLMGNPFPVHRIVRVKDGRVVSTGAYEKYYNPHSPGWEEIAQ
jgi:hypothetical protein